jgi:hypothetical protein
MLSESGDKIPPPSPEFGQPRFRRPNSGRSGQIRPDGRIPTGWLEWLDLASPPGQIRPAGRIWPERPADRTDRLGGSGEIRPVGWDPAFARSSKIAEIRPLSLKSGQPRFR